MFEVLRDEMLRGADFLCAYGFAGILTVFWHFFFIDLPRYFIADLFVLCREWLLRSPLPLSPNRHRPLVSVIVPAYNREKTIAATIRSLRHQTYPNLEIVISDDGSGDGTAEACRPFVETGQVRLVQNTVRGGKASALNRALRFCRGEFIVQIDSDSSFDRDAIENIVRPLYDPDVGAVSGNLRAKNARDNLLTELQNLEYLRSISVGRRFNSALNILSIVSGAFGAYRRSELDKVGGWELGPGDDSDMTIKTRKLKKRIVFEPRAVCMTDVPCNLAAFIRQRIRWNRSLVRNRLRKHRDIFNPRHANFSLPNVVSFVDQLYFQMFRGYSYLAYVFYVVVFLPDLLVPIFIANYFLYTGMGLLETLLAWVLSERKRGDLAIFQYVPLFTFYKGLFLRTVRLYAYFEELAFRTSYTDPFVPPRVGAAQIRW
jgi:cellulose synthase/poly-beta-1,6-N-acetylglucosamine synthase-like glycosyltransferase